MNSRLLYIASVILSLLLTTEALAAPHRKHGRHKKRKKARTSIHAKKHNPPPQPETLSNPEPVTAVTAEGTQEPLPIEPNAPASEDPLPIAEQANNQADPNLDTSDTQSDHAADDAVTTLPVFKPLSIGLLGGWGFKDGYKLGFGARIGYTAPFGLYVGGTFVYHLGISQSSGGATSKGNIMYTGAELGYDVRVSPLVIRPYVGLGLAMLKSEVTGTGISDFSATSSRFALWPGLAFLVYPAPMFFVGADARYVVITGSNGGSASAFSAMGTLGLSF